MPFIPHAKGFFPRRPEAAAGWLPSDLAGLSFWVDSNTYVEDVTPGVVYRWNDLALGNHLLQAITASRPAVVANEPVNPAIQFDGVDDWMRQAVPSGINQPMSIFARLKQTNDGFAFTSDVGGVYLPYQRRILYAGANLAFAPFNTTDYHTLAFLCNGASSSVRVDGVQVIAGAAGANGLDRIEVGAWTSGTSFWFAGLIKSILVYDSVITGADLTDVEDYLTALP